MGGLGVSPEAEKKSFQAKLADAEAGVETAQLDVARDYVKGRIVEKNGPAAHEWFVRASRSLDPDVRYPALYESCALLDGFPGMKTDYRTVTKRLEAVSASGHPAAEGARYDLAMMKISGKGQRPDPAAGIAALEDLAWPGHNDFAYGRILGTLYSDPRMGKPDPEKAANWFRLSAEAGNGYSQYEIGTRLLKGDGIKSDPVQGQKWLESAGKVAAREHDAKLASHVNRAFAIIRAVTTPAPSEVLPRPGETAKPFTLN